MPTTKKKARATTSRLSRKQILQAARRFYVQEETQTSIAKDLGISNSYLARLLKQARENGWVRIYVDADRETELAARLMERFPALEHVEVVPSAARPEDTARALGTVAAEWLNDLLDEDDAREEPQIWNIAVGGGAVHQAMVEQVVPRANRISVGPTALTPERGRVSRFTAPTLAAQLAMKLGALTPGANAPRHKDRTGYRFNLTVDPPENSLGSLRQWYAALQVHDGFKDLSAFWQRVDVAFLGVVPLDLVYDDAKRRLESLGIPLEALVERGAVALVANQFIDACGRAVPIAESIPSYEPAISLEQLTNHPEHSRRQSVVVDMWGRVPKSAYSLLQAGCATVLLTDVSGANALLGS